MKIKEQVLDMIKEEHNNAMGFYSHLRRLSEQSLFAIEECYDNIYNRIETEVSEPQVKQLVWEDDCAIAFRINEDEFIEYEVVTCPTRLFLDNTFISTFTTKAKAKAYAQTHFESLIKSCLGKQ